MADRSNNTVHIGQLNISVPGSNAEAGQRISSQLANNLAQQLPAGLQGHIGALNLRVSVAPSASESEISSAVSDSIIGALAKSDNHSKTRNFPKGQKR